MNSLADCKHKSLLDLTGLPFGDTNDLENIWLLQETGESFGQTDDLWFLYLINEGVSQASLNDMWFEWFTGKGYTGAINDMWLQFWCDQADAPLWVLDSGNWDDSGVWDDTANWNDGVAPPVGVTFDPSTANNVILSNSNQTAQSNYTVPSGPFGTPVNVDSEEFPVLQERTISINIDAYNGLGNTPATSIAILGLYSVVSGIGVESGITFLSDGSLITEGTFNVSGVNPLFGALPTIVLGQATTYEGLIVIKPSGNVYIGLSIGGAAPVYLSWDGVSGSIPQLNGDPVNDLNPTFTLPNNTDQYFYQIGATQQAGQPVVTWQVTADFDS